MELSSVIIKPYLTEKTYAVRGDTKKRYAFIVALKATKNDIKLAFESIFDIEPEAVNTIIRKPSKTKKGTAHPGYKKIKKIAYIILPEGKDIALSQEDLAQQTAEQNSIAEVKEVKTETKAVKAVKEVKTETKAPKAVKEVKTETKAVKAVKEVKTETKAVKAVKEVKTETKEKDAAI